MVKRKFCKAIIGVVWVFFFTSCSKKAQLESNSSFVFKDLTDSYESNTATFTRRYYNDTIRIKVKLSLDEKKQILQSFSENNFQKFPNEIDCSNWGTSPKIYDELTLDNHTVKYIHNIDEDLFCLKGKKFSNINILIKDIVMNKPDVKKLEISNIAYE